MLFLTTIIRINFSGGRTSNVIKRPFIHPSLLSKISEKEPDNWALVVLNESCGSPQVSAKLMYRVSNKRTRVCLL